MYIGVGIGTAVVVIFAIVVLVMWCRCRRKAGKQDSPREMPDPYPPVITESEVSSSTTHLVQHEGLSAESLPIAPPPPQVEHEPNPLGHFDKMYENTVGQGEDGDGVEDYLQPQSWKPQSDDLYIPMGVPVMLGQQPVPSSQLTAEYADPSVHHPKPLVCGGSKGYVNVPNSGATTATPAKYPKVNEEEDEDQEDYQNLPKGVTAPAGNGVVTRNTNTLPKYANLSAEDMKRASPRSLPKVPKTKVKTGQTTKGMTEQTTKGRKEQTTNGRTEQTTKGKTEQTTKRVTPKVTPKVKHKQSSQDEGGDYVNVKEYSKKPGVIGRPDMVELKHALKLKGKKDH
ncbi:uncharacterized protein LOC124113641 isoform X2 [Haliotis rufescens]|nr:uncharacterized protein LOC124113641 isoform X2 [Haliotis rufescens]